MKTKSPKRINAVVNLTRDEHLQVQKEIERRAHELWNAAGCRQTASLNDWIEAEHEVMEQFLQFRLRRNSRQSDPTGAAQRANKRRLRFAPSKSAIMECRHKTPAYEYYL